MAVIYALLRVRLNNVQSKLFVHKKYSNHRRNRHYFSANGPFLLLPLALKWGLFLLLVMVIVPCINAKGVSAASLTLEIPTTPLTLDISPSENGTFSKSSLATIKISTSALAGYSLSIKAKDGSELKNENTTDKITSITENVAENAFNTNSIYNNKYGFAFGSSGTLTTTNNTFHSGVNTVIATTNEPNTEENAYDIVLGARVSSNIAAVQYANTFVVMASANPVPYHINYEANTEDKVSGMPENGDGKTDTGLFVLPSNNPKRDNYRFIGWCDGETSVENGVDICDKATYQPEDNYELTTKDEEITLLAMWAEDSKIMQNWKGCDSLNYSTRNNPQEITLIDARDNKMYYVAKLADGRCWMTENLDLDIDSNRTYTVADTDLAYATDDDKGSSVDEDGNYQWKPEKSTYSTGTISNDLSDYNARSYDVGNYCWKSETITSDRTPGLQPGSPEFGEFAVACVKHQAVVGSDPHYHLGNYYNYGAAVAQNDTSKKTEQYDKYETSICPSGWQLPTREDDGIATFQKVINAAITEEARAIGYEAIKSGKEIDGGNVHLAPYYYTFAGYWRGSVGQLGFKGHFASSVIYSSNESFHIDIGGEGYLVAFGRAWYRMDAISVRCVARQ